MLADEVSRLVESSLDQLERDEAVALVSTLISAGSAVSEELTLEAALHTIADVGRRLTGARFGAIGVLSPAGVFERFIHVGMSGPEISAIGDLPVGRGVLGSVIATQHPIRLDDLTTEPLASGIPAHHPDMHSFLGVPIYIEGVVYGNLYLTESGRGGFTPLDEDVIVALAHIAGGAISNARRFQLEQMTNSLIDRATANAQQVLLSTELAADFDSVVADVAELLSCDVVASHFVIDATTHAFAESSEISEQLRNELRSITREVVAHQSPNIDAAETHMGSVSGGPALIVPFTSAQGTTVGALVALRPHNGLPFVDAERAALASFARTIAASRELALSRAAEHRLTLTEERERIARDLHDHVIQNLFAIGLSIDGVVGRTPPEVATRLANQVDEIDATIRKIRHSIFDLSEPTLAGATSFRARIHTMVRQILEEHSIDYRVEFEGPVDSLLADTHHGDVEAVVRETVSNIVRHSQATRASVAVRVSPAHITIEVSDDGIGIGDETRRSGLANLEARATKSGGTFRIDTATPHGTTIQWHIPRGEQ